MERSDDNGVSFLGSSNSTSSSPSSSSIFAAGGNDKAGQLGINAQLLQGFNGGNFSVINYGFNGGNFSKRPVGIPPSHPYTQFGAVSASNQQQQQGSGLMVRPSHTRSWSQPSGFSFDHLPPLSPVGREVTIAVAGVEQRLSSGDGGSVSGGNVEQRMGSGSGNGGGSVSGGNVALPPRGRGHRRSSSDVPAGFQVAAQKPAQLVLKKEVDCGGGGGEKKNEGEAVDDMITGYLNWDSIEAMNSSSMEEKDSRASGTTRTNESSENEGESSGVSSHSVDGRGKGKRAAPGEIAPPGRHFRSLSMDSFMENLSFDEQPRLPPSPGFLSAQHSPSNSLDGGVDLEFGNAEFTPAEWKKIKANEKLSEIALSDPKRVRRILANRLSAARSKERKSRYISELEHKVQTLQTEATTLSAQLTVLQRDSAGLNIQNNELKFRIQAMEQQAQLKDALLETLNAEVQRLKLTAQNLGMASPNFLPQQLIPTDRAFQMQLPPYMHQFQFQQPQQRQQQPAPSQNQQPQPSKSAQSQSDGS